MARRRKSQNRRRKSAIRITNAELRSAEHAADERTDAAAVRTPSHSVLPTLAEWRAERDRITAEELLDTARNAAALEMRGANYGGADRADAAAEILRRVLLDTGGAMPPRESPRVTLTAFCDLARNLRRSLDRQRQHDAAEEKRQAHVLAQSDAALGIEVDDTPAKHAAIVARSSEHAAECAVSAVLTRLHLADETDGASGWLTLYQWVTGETAAAVATRRGIGQKLAEKRIASGAKLLRSRFTAAELAARLTLGGSSRRTVGRDTPDTRIVIGGSGREYPTTLDYGDMLTAQAPVLTIVLGDASAEAGAPSKVMSEAAMGRRHWREGTDAGVRPAIPADAAQARAGCALDTLPASERVHWRRRREHRTDTDAETAAALRRVARIHALQSRRAPKAEKTESGIGRASIGAGAAS